MSRKQFAIVLLTAAVCSLVGGAIMSRVLAPRPASAIIDIPTKIPDVITARRFVVVDDNDRTRATLTDSGFRLLGPDKVTRVVIGENGLEVYDAKGKVRFKTPEAAD